MNRKVHSPKTQPVKQPTEKAQQKESGSVWGWLKGFFGQRKLEDKSQENKVLYEEPKVNREGPSIQERKSTVTLFAKVNDEGRKEALAQKQAALEQKITASKASVKEKQGDIVELAISSVEKSADWAEKVAGGIWGGFKLLGDCLGLTEDIDYNQKIEDLDKEILDLKVEAEKQRFQVDLLMDGLESDLSPEDKNEKLSQLGNHVAALNKQNEQIDKLSAQINSLIDECGVELNKRFVPNIRFVYYEKTNEIVQYNTVGIKEYFKLGTGGARVVKNLLPYAKSDERRWLLKNVGMLQEWVKNPNDPKAEDWFIKNVPELMSALAHVSDFKQFLPEQAMPIVEWISNDKNRAWLGEHAFSLQKWISNPGHADNQKWFKENAEAAIDFVGGLKKESWMPEQFNGFFAWMGEPKNRELVKKGVIPSMDWLAKEENRKWLTDNVNAIKLWLSGEIWESDPAWVEKNAEQAKSLVGSLEDNSWLSGKAEAFLEWITDPKNKEMVADEIVPSMEWLANADNQQWISQNAPKLMAWVQAPHKQENRDWFKANVPQVLGYIKGLSEKPWLQDGRLKDMLKTIADPEYIKALEGNLAYYGDPEIINWYKKVTVHSYNWSFFCSELGESMKKGYGGAFSGLAPVFGFLSDYNVAPFPGGNEQIKHYVKATKTGIYSGVMVPMIFGAVAAVGAGIATAGVGLPLALLVIGILFGTSFGPILGSFAGFKIGKLTDKFSNPIKENIDLPED